MPTGRKLLTLLALAILLAPGLQPQAALAPATEPVTRLELLVIEVPNCKVCDLVRERVQPAYERTLHARAIPLRYLDINDAEAGRLALAGPVDVVPTIVLMRDGVEVDRVTGYTGPQLFLEALAAMVRNAE
jgi:hypothetical protein